MLARLHIPPRLGAGASLLVVCALALCGAFLAPAADLQEIRYWSLGDATRVVVQLDGEFTYKWNRLEDPPRIFFDLPNVNLALVKRVSDRGRIRTIEVNDTILRQIRYAENSPGRARVVLDLNESCEVNTSQLANPARLVIELRSRKTLAPGVQVSRSGVMDLTEATEGEATSAQAARATASSTPPISGTPPSAGKPEPGASAQASRPRVPPPSREQAIAQNAVESPVISGRSSEALSSSSSASDHAGEIATVATNQVLMALEPTATTSLAPEQPAGMGSPEPALAPVAARAAGSPTASGGAGAGNSADPEAPLAMPAKRTTNGSQSLVRALGLKIGRVVIDPGHGGKDHGTTGVNGLKEKDLVLDVSLRLAQLVRERLGSDVVLTRDEDVFVPLEQRTEIANRNRADLFLSVHANSSPYKLATGSETFFLNFTTSREAMDVAARENASSQRSVGELQDIVRKIALKDKRDESEDFAARIQTALYRAQRREGFAPKNRGVKSAPFIVLVGAEMPSVLVEIGFLSNAKEESALKTPEYRQKIAEALLDGLEDYMGSLSHFEGRERASVRE